MVEDSGCCQICGLSLIVKIAPFDSPAHHVVHCHACGHETLRPLPTADELALYYSDYSTTKTSDAELRFLYERSLEFFENFVANTDLKGTDLSGRNYLEIGFGNGAGLFAAAASGFRTFGVDLDESSVARARTVAPAFDVSVECSSGTIDDYRRDIEFHVVKASQVIEHTLDPLKFLQQIAVLQPVGGYLVLEFPNNDAAFWALKNLLRKRYGRMNFYKSLKIGEHLSGFTRESIAILLRKAGYRLLRCRDYPMRHRFLQPENLLWYPSLLEGVAESARTRDPYHLLKSLIPVFDHVASNIAGSGTHLYVWAEKKP